MDKLAEELGKVGYIVYTEHDARNALDLITKNKEIKIVLISLDAETYDGIELLMHIIRPIIAGSRTGFYLLSLPAYFMFL